MTQEGYVEMRVKGKRKLHACIHTTKQHKEISFIAFPHGSKRIIENKRFRTAFKFNSLQKEQAR
jgi:hypothetical protein